MPQLIRCPHCQQNLQVPEGAAGTLRCPLCKQLFAVRATPAPPPVVSSKPTNGARVKQQAPAPSRPVPRSTPVTAPAPGVCPSCKAKVPLGASACLECGYLLQTETNGLESDEAPNLCPN